MKDYRTPEHRGEYFAALYETNLRHGTMPGLVYLYMPALAHALGWDEKTKLWFAFLNGMTQNPLTSLRLLEQLPEPPENKIALAVFKQWFDAEWPRLQYDTDRRYAKKETCEAIKSYCWAAAAFGDSQTTPQVDMLSLRSWEAIWGFVTSSFRSFGRLSAFSYLEYVRIMGHGCEPDTLLFSDKSGSKSHRNGMLFLTGLDELVNDKRTGRGPVAYENFGKMCVWLQERADIWQAAFNEMEARKGSTLRATNFTFESQLCQFKNSFFGRRYPGVYADMAWERLQWYKTNVGQDRNCRLIADIYHSLPDWLQYGNDRLTVRQRAAIFPRTGVPYRAEHFLE